VRLKRPRGSRRRRLSPELVDQLVGRDDLVGMEKEDRQQRTLLTTAELYPPTLVRDLERAKNPKSIFARSPFRSRGAARPQPDRNKL
jgi:hypothetical protein